MERFNLPLSELSFAQKLDLMETLWTDITKSEKELESPAWHESILNEREEALTTGKVTVSDWNEAKKRIRQKVS